LNATRITTAVLALVLLTPLPARASFHFMQIEQVIGGVNGDVTAQAVQLRMRAGGQNVVSFGRLVARDATGANPITLIDMTTNVSNGAAGSRVLVCTAAMGASLGGLVPDFVMTNPIPPSYLAAGSLTWEQDPPSSTILWRVSWGGAGYTGSGVGGVTNDADGNFNPAFAGPLPSTTEQALQFRFAFNAASTNNANDYALTAGAATFTKNSGTSATITAVAGVGNELEGSRLMLSPPAPNPVRSSMTYSFVLPRDARAEVRILDVRGRVVRSLVDERLPAGRHIYTWDARGDSGVGLSSGLYFLDLNAGGARKSQRFALIR
jgi:hypothetical protein